MSRLSSSLIENLENRRLMAGDGKLLRVGSVTADNRGEVIIKFSEAAVGVRGGAGQMYTAGSDGKFFTSDDVKVNARVTYSVNRKQMTIKGNLAAGTPYRIKLDGKTRIRAADDNSLLDGNFNDPYYASGDGKAGGNFEFVATANNSKTRTIKMRTNYGDIYIKLREDVAPVSADKFSDLADAGKYDKLIVSRSAPGFVVQLGSLQVTGDAQDAGDVIENSASDFPEELPRRLSNTRNTISFARGGGLASNQFFFNIADNDGSGATTNLDDASGGGGATFTPFAEVTQGMSLIDQIAQAQRYNLTGVMPNVGGTSSKTGVDSFPVRAPITDGQFIPVRDAWIVERTGSLMILDGK